MLIGTSVISVPFSKEGVVYQPSNTAFSLVGMGRSVITDTFHGTIFSEKYNGRYAVLLRESNTNKLSDLVERLGLHDHVIDSFRHLNGAYDVFGCREHSKIMQQAERIRSLEYLKTNVSNAIEE